MESWGEGKDTVTQFFFKPGAQKFQGLPGEFLKTLFQSTDPKRSLSAFKDYKSQFP